MIINGMKVVDKWTESGGQVVIEILNDDTGEVRYFSLDIAEMFGQSLSEDEIDLGHLVQYRRLMEY